MKQTSAEFDAWSASYDQLLQDPLRDRFARGAEFFHTRKRDIVCEYFTERSTKTRGLKYLDVGCGKGELVRLLQQQFACVAGCDPSSGMLREAQAAAPDVDFRCQSDLRVIPFESNSVDFVTAVCVYHHVPPAERAALTREVRRVLKPGGVFAVIEHNPWNPVTRLIVSRTPVDAEAVLLTARESRTLLWDQGFSVDWERYFLYFPEVFYHKFHRLETALGSLPLGGQYALFGHKAG